MTRRLDQPEPTATFAPEPHGDDTPLQQRLSAILDEYLTLLEAGNRVEDECFLAGHADLADQLRPHLANLRAMQLAIGPAQGDAPKASVYEAPPQLGSYTLKREIGRGGQGIVYEADDATLNRRVALKVLPFAALLDRKQIDRFNNEAQAAARLHHPNIVPVYAVGVDRGVHFYAMQYIDGAPLSDAIQQLSSLHDPRAAGVSTLRPHSTNACGPISSWIMSDAAAADADYQLDENHCRQVARLGIELAGGLAHAHEVGIVHRDIKPSNLLLDESGKPWIADFGLARIPNDVSMTATGDVLGTIRYMSPEQAKGRNAYVDHRTDIYSLGVTLYELLTLQPAFPASDREEFMQQIGSKEPVAPRRINAAIPADLENIILRAIESDPVDRYESAEQFAQDLQRYLDGKPTLAKRAAVSDRFFKWARRHRRMVTAAAACLLMWAVGLSVASLMIARETNRATREADRAVAALREARDILDELGVSMSDRLAMIPGAEDVRRDLLITTHSYYNSLLEKSDDPVLRLDRGITLAKSGNLAEQLGDIRQALELYEQARGELEEMALRHPNNQRYQSELANCLNNESMLLARLGKLDVAAEKLSAAVACQQSLLERRPGDDQIVGDLACSQANLAFVYEQSQQLEASQAAYEAAITLYRRSSDQGPTEFAQRRQLAVSLHNLASLVARNDLQRAQQLCDEAIQTQQQLVSENARLSALQAELAISYDRRAELFMLAEQPHQADAAYAKAVAILKQLVAAAPKHVGHREDLAITLNHWGDLYRELESYDDAERVFDEAARLLTTMVEMAPDQPAFRSSLGAVLFNQGWALLELEQRDAAYQLWQEGLTHQQSAVASAPTIKRYRKFLDLQRTSLQEAFPETITQN
jgi:serine/threonine protein kinase